MNRYMKGIRQRALVGCSSVGVMLGCVSSQTSAITMVEDSSIIKGRVVNLEDTPIKDAIALLYRGGDSSGDDIASATSDGDGFYRFSSDHLGAAIPAGKYVIRVGKQEFNPYQMEIVFDGGSLVLSEPVQLLKLDGPNLAPVALPASQLSPDGMAIPEVGPAHGN